MYTVLICDDEKEIRTALRITLSGAGYRTLEAEDGHKALELLAEQEADLVLLDIMMPVMDGLTVLSELRQRGSALPRQDPRTAVRHRRRNLLRRRRRPV